MKLALLTHHWPPNFGANLQALSTYRFLTNHGYDVWVLNYRPAFLEERYRQKVSQEQMTAHNDFCNKYLRLSPVIRSEDELVDYCNELEFDRIAVGSDSVFRVYKDMTTDEGIFPNPFWLTWVSKLKNKTKTGALAGSCTGSMYLTLPNNVKQGIVKALDNFDYISVRDRWTRWMFYLVSRGKYRPNICPDPTSVFNQVCQIPNEYLRGPEKKHKKYILLSAKNDMLPYEWVRRFVAIAHRHNREVFSLPLPQSEIDLPVDSVIRLPLSPLGWYAWIQHAAGFLGIRFHPIACSIFNNVPFISIDNNLQKCFKHIPVRLRSKQYDLCKNIGTLSHCLDPDKFRKITPTKAWFMLENWNNAQFDRYIRSSREDFSANIERLLNS